MSNQNKNNGPLTADEAMKLGGAYQRFSELRGLVVQTPTSEAELKGLTEYLATTLIDHASEFIGCWFAVRNEYEPILGLLARIGERVSGIHAQNAAKHQAQSQAATADSAEPSNIITLK
jgi:hypothetical protein